MAYEQKGQKWNSNLKFQTCIFLFYPLPFHFIIYTQIIRAVQLFIFGVLLAILMPTETIGLDINISYMSAAKFRFCDRSGHLGKRIWGSYLHVGVLLGSAFENNSWEG